MSPKAARAVPPPDADQGLAADIVPLGYLIVEILDFLDGLERRTGRNLSDLDTLRTVGERTSLAIAEVGADMQRLSAAAAETETTAAERLDSLSAHAERFRRLAEWGTGIWSRTYELERIFNQIVGANSQIARIARQVNILAVNASIEAARAGDAGRGFAIVADAINELSRKTSDAAGGIAQSIEALDDWTRAMRDDSERYAPDFEVGIAGADETSRAVRVIAEEMTRARTSIAAVDSSMRTLDADNLAAQPVTDAIARTAKTVAAEVERARAHAGRMMETCETLLQRVVEQEEDGPDHRFIAYAAGMAARVQQEMEAGLAGGLISRAELFAFDYAPIPGTDPVQHETPFARFTDRTVQHLLEEALGFDPAVTFCAVCDRNGYIPTHNLKFSLRPGPDPAWNTAHCRNRRIFSDRAGRKAGANRAPFLLQVYRRDMGADGKVMMKDISVPITIGGRHWGGLRMGYRETAGA